MAGFRRGVGLCALCALFVIAGPASSQAAFPSGANGKIAFEVFDDSQSDLYSVNADGSSLTNLTKTPQSGEYNVTFSPDAKRILFERAELSDMNGFSDLFLANADGSSPINLTNTPGNYDVTPGFSPDGRKIAFSRCDSTGDTCNLAEIDLSTLAVRQLTNTQLPAYDIDPAYSPDGATIAFRRGSDDRRELWLMGADGSGVRPLTSAPNVYDSRPNFTSDGQRILFDRFDSGPLDSIFSITPSGTGLTDLTKTTSPRSAIEPSPSPDGHSFAFSDCNMGDCKIGISNADGSGQTDITSNTSPVVARDPDWQDIQTCRGRQVTLVGDDGPDKIKGTKHRDVIDANGGKDTVIGRGGSDLICLGAGKDKAIGGGGRDVCVGGQGKDSAKGCERGKL